MSFPILSPDKKVFCSQNTFCDGKRRKNKNSFNKKYLITKKEDRNDKKEERK